ncbi:hypothetical protein amyaer_1864 [Microcystis aeruginosa NIES-2481]|nr:hypothetical protein amyaer_1864 [Microcystis aeruginosa NIES-2481]
MPQTRTLRDIENLKKKSTRLRAGKRKKLKKVKKGKKG